MSGLLGTITGFLMSEAFGPVCLTKVDLTLNRFLNPAQVCPSQWIMLTLRTILGPSNVVCTVSSD